MFQLTPPPYWRAERTARRQKQYKEQNLDREEYAEDHFTGSSGGTIYDGDAFPSEYYGNVFTGDVAGNLVHRDVLVPSKDSPVMIAKRAEGEATKEFLASRDSWFRPAGFTIGPDGYLYVIDMYRQHIETPLSIPEDLKQDMDFLKGSDLGRIYRIRPDEEVRKSEVPKLKDMAASEYVKLLAHPNRWYRLQAQRLLLERQDKSVIASVTDLFESHEDPRTRLHALYVLEGLDALTSSIARRATEDSHPGVRKHGLILAERFPELLPRIIELTKDSSLQVVLQATLSAGEFSGPEVTQSLAYVTSTYGKDRWIRTAVLSAEAGRSAQLLDLLSKNSFFDKTDTWKAEFLEEFASAMASDSEPAGIRRLLAVLKQPMVERHGQWQSAGMKGLIKGLGSNDKCDPKIKEWLKNAKADTNQEARSALNELSEFYARM
jgi:hypothetical protein